MLAAQFHDMTSLIYNLFGRQPCFSTIPNLADEAQTPHRERNRLRKEPPFEIFYSCDDLLDTTRSQSYLTLRPNHSNATVEYRDHPEPQPRQANHPSMKLQHSHDSIGLYSQNEMKPEELRRTRAKTPVFRIGQLESKICFDTGRDFDTARVLAQQYQAALPSRGITPCPEDTAPNTHRNGLRRIKCHDSLRDIVKSHPVNIQSPGFATPDLDGNDFPDKASPLKQGNLQDSFAENMFIGPRPPGSRFLRGSFESRSDRRHSSDSETLLGSDSEMSPNSSALPSFPHSDLDAIKLLRNSHISIVEEALPDSMPTDNVGMQLCLDLLTKDLATALYRQHPAEPGSRASGLQILLMIEAYEALQQRLREEMGNSHLEEISEDLVNAAQNTLDHWLKALHSIYEHSLSQNRGNLRDSVAL